MSSTQTKFEGVTTFENATPEQQSRWWRTIMGEYPTGVAIITSVDDDGKPQGMVVNTFASVSMDPPLISYMPMKSSHTYQAIADTKNFRVTILGAGHENLCRSFVRSPETRFTVGNWELDDEGIPYLKDAVIQFDCTQHDVVEAGDHDIVIGRVRDLGYGDGTHGMPLLFLKGGYGSFTMPRLEFRPQHLGSHLRVADQMADAIQRLAEEQGVMVTLCSLNKDTVVVLGAANLQATHQQAPAVGATFPLAAPMGVVFAAWSNGSQNQIWRRDGKAMGFEDDALLEAMVKRVQERGYAVSIGPTMSEEFETIVGDPRRNESDLTELWENIVNDYRELDDREDWPAHVSSIQVPVVNTDGNANLALAVSQLPMGMTHEELEKFADRCKAVATQLSEML